MSKTKAALHKNNSKINPMRDKRNQLIKNCSL